MKKSIFSLLFLLGSGCASSTTTPVATAPTPADRYLWLEDSKNPKVMSWVEDHNAKSRKALETDPRAHEVASEIRKIITAQDRIPMPSMHGDKIRNFWQDQKHVRGIWRQTSFKEYAKAAPKWETILDVDALNKREHKSWVFHGAHCLPPAHDVCLIELSDGGRDEAVWREFKVSSGKFIKGGFELPPAKSRVSWFDKDTLLIGTDFGPDSLTDSGYPREVRLWKRGTPFKSADLIFAGNKSDVDVGGYMSMSPDGTHYLIGQGLTFFTEKNFIYEPGKPLQALPFPESARLEGIFKNDLLVFLRQDWTVAGKTFARGSLLSLPIAAVAAGPNGLTRLEQIYTPDDQSSLEGVAFTRDYLMLNILHNVIGEVRRVRHADGAWSAEKLPMPDGGTVYITSLDVFDPQNRVFLTYESFTQPTTLYLVDDHGLQEMKRMPARFDASNLVTDQFFALSKDGTKVPYFMVHQKNMALDGTHPTLLNAYGGFEVSRTPQYLNSTGKLWVEKGGVYALANIRGGGEYGPRWHEAALKENRQRAYDDFAAVAEDMFARKITSPRRLGIQGGSNGGLLVGVATTQHPDFYHAVVCESALLDMIRYTKLPPGASWIGEYGDPEDAHMAEVISKYSPYQNIHAGTKYPKVFFHISTADDRVQPGHTRKMVARMEENGADVLMFENTEGGHGGAADLEQRVKKSTLVDIYLYQQLMD